MFIIIKYENKLNNRVVAKKERHLSNGQGPKVVEMVFLYESIHDGYRWKPQSGTKPIHNDGMKK